MSRARAIATLVRWLGPWAGTRVPRDVRRVELAIDGGPGARALRAYEYRAARGRPLGVDLVVLGLHYQGPDDPRMDRFCRVLAEAGLVVVAPLLPDHLALRVAPQAEDDVARGFAHAESIAIREGLPAPGVFTISFGSLPAIRACARSDLRDRVGGMVLFGGYADFDAAVRFALTGRAEHEGRAIEVPFDPLNSPVVFLALLDPLAPNDQRAALAAALRQMVERTWGRAELKAPGARDPIAHEIAATLPGGAREIFFEACGLRPLRLDAIDRALTDAREAFAFADPTPHLAKLRAPVAIVHGQDDDVIPWLEAEKLRARLPAGHPHRVLLTGMYGHTGAMLPGPRALAREARTMLDVVRAMVDAPTGRLG